MSLAVTLLLVVAGLLLVVIAGLHAWGRCRQAVRLGRRLGERAGRLSDEAAGLAARVDALPGVAPAADHCSGRGYRPR